MTDADRIARLESAVADLTEYLGSLSFVRADMLRAIAASLRTDHDAEAATETQQIAESINGGTAN